MRLLRRTASTSRGGSRWEARMTLANESSGRARAARTQGSQPSRCANNASTSAVESLPVSSRWNVEASTQAAEAFMVCSGETTGCSTYNTVIGSHFLRENG